jgi:acyl dehydratase
VEKLSVGDAFEYPITFTQDDVRLFSELSGDVNNIHFDDELANESPIGTRAIPGLLGALVFSRILGTIFPGHGTVYATQSLRFRRPILIDKPYVARICVKRVVPDKHRAKVITEIADATSGEIATRGQAWIVHKIKL